MKLKKEHIKFFSLATLFIFAALIIFPSIVKGKTKRLTFENKKIIVIDPGHGGRDNGVRGVNGTSEKTVTLALAKIIEAKLKNEYEIICTRSGDYQLDIPSRVNKANHIEADIFISLHTGGSFLHQTKGVFIFYFQELPEHSLAQFPKNTKQKNSQTLWRNIQSKHQASSKDLAQSIQKCFLQLSIESKVQGIPLMVLSGADMPAALIEIGYLTNPDEETKLCNPKILSDFAKGIQCGINKLAKTKNKCYSD